MTIWKDKYNWDIGQTVKMSPCHGVRSGFNSRISRLKNSKELMFFDMWV